MAAVMKPKLPALVLLLALVSMLQVVVVVVGMQVLEVSRLGEAGHLFAAEARREGVTPSERITALGREISALASDLPLSANSSVFVALDDEKMMLWRAVIVGPTDTPYAGGCFIFDLYFPPTYPQVCPQVKLKTTGGGKVRFNPNLYNCGKVCLSLLGTWMGEKGEGWLPKVSTANQ
ncbi:ubiquitin_conjugat_2 domain-containing protein, partial [Haematococcus lacustris]